jgi:ornithine cyclodeaminase/alanine dehydrogenase
MESEGTLLLRRRDVEQLLTLPECITAVEDVFRMQGEGKVPPAGILGVKAGAGGLHIKTALLRHDKNYLVAKLNTNFPDNRVRAGLPTIQGLIVLCDGENGSPLAVLDSIDITIKRTAAASAVAAKYLARPNSSVATLCGCGQQAPAQLRALCAVLPLRQIYVFDLDQAAAQDFAAKLSGELQLEIESITDLGPALRKSDVCLTCTTANKFFVSKEEVAPGTFIAAVGADDSHKQEIDPGLMASVKIVADSLEQCCAIGDTHHAIAQGLMRKENVYAELSEIVAGRKDGRQSDDEIIVFDSTGVAIEDAIAAVAVYEKARASGAATRFDFAA